MPSELHKKAIARITPEQRNFWVKWIEEQGIKGLIPESTPLGEMLKKLEDSYKEKGNLPQ